MKCQNCGALLNSFDRFCSYCGTEVTAQTAAETPVQQVHVHHHHHYDYEEPEVVEQEAEQVIYTTMPPVTTPTSTKSRFILLILYLVGGAWGLHKFYSGRFGMGFFYLLTGGFFGIGLFFDFFSILFGNPRDDKGFTIQWQKNN